MPAPKGSRNAAAYQEAVVDQARVQIENALSAASRSGVAFPNVSTLAGYLALKVGRSASRLRRNQKYRTLLDGYISRQRGAAGLITARDRNVDALKAKLRAAEIEISTLTQDRNRLSALIDKLLPRIGGDGTAQLMESLHSTGREIDYRAAFEDTAYVLAALLERVGEFGYEVDREKGVIRDRDAHPRLQEVSEPERTRWFTDWLSSKRP